MAYVRDGLWAVIGALFDQYKEDQAFSYADLGRRIGKKRSQVQRWLSRPSNMTTSSAGLLVEGLDADLSFVITPRAPRDRGRNDCHPADDAKAFVDTVKMDAPQASYINNDLNGFLQRARTSAYRTEVKG